METIRKLSSIRNEREVEWRIEDFFTLLTEDGEWYESPLFYFANASWCLRFYTNAREQDESVGYITVFLLRKCSGSPISLDYSLILKTMDEKTDREWHSSNVFAEAGDGWGFCNSLKRSDVLTVVCVMKYVETTDDATSEKVLQDWKAVMLDGDLSDILIKVKGEEFRLHRTVLAARNSYFHSMFTSDMKEKNTGIVCIEDCEPDIFRSFIHFVYVGKVDKLLPDNVCELYEVADKYLEDQLKKQCYEFMKKSLSEDTFFDFIVLAIKYDERELFEKAAEFYISEQIEIVRSVKWRDFLEKYPTQAIEFFNIVDRHFI